MKISYNWLQKYFDKELPNAHDLAGLINSHVFEIESEQRISDKSGKNIDVVYDVKVLPDRAHYALCHKGIAREVRAITGQNIKPEMLDPKSLANTFSIDKNVAQVKVDVQDKKLCRRYIARRIDGVTIGGSPTWLSEKLEAVDSRSINSIVDATNYIMLDCGQPLHAFDADKVVGGITVRLAKKGEKIELLPERVLVDGVWSEKPRKLELGDTDLVIADDEGPLAIAGVKGGKRAEISTTTKNIILESANFHPVSVRRTSTRLNVRNDSSKRFENEIVPELAEMAMSHVTALMVEMSSGAKVGEVTDIFSAPTKQWTVSVGTDFISDKLGTKVSADQFREVLKRYDCEVKVGSGKGDVFSIIPPLDRLDLKIPEDFVDEVARVNGYDNLSPVLPPELPAKFASNVKDNSTFYWSEKVKNVLVNQGFSETLLYSLVAKGFYEITYPLASDKAFLRETIVAKMKEVLVANTLNADLLGVSVVKIFEIGKVFTKDGEKTMLCIGVKNVKKSKKKEADILKETLSEIEKVLSVKIEAKIDPKVADNIVEIDFDAMISKLTSGSSDELDFEALPRDQRYHPFSLYPFITRDIAVFVPKDIVGDGIWKTIKHGIQDMGAADLLVRDSLFDVFEKDGKVSYAYRLVFQSYKKTLTDDEVNKIMEKVYSEVRGKGWEVR